MQYNRLIGATNRHTLITHSRVSDCTLNDFLSVCLSVCALSIYVCLFAILGWGAKKFSRASRASKPLAPQP